jgi:RNA 3'-terminal phosphate cyclase
MIEVDVIIDGSRGEGGGQILRASLALSVLTDKSVRVHNIRALRPKPGLAAQHLAGALAVQAVTQGNMEGAALLSTSICLSPGATNRREWHQDLPLCLDFVKTAGSTALVLQAVLPCLLRYAVSSCIGAQDRYLDALCDTVSALWTHTNIETGNLYSILQIYSVGQL